MQNSRLPSDRKACEQDTVHGNLADGDTCPENNKHSTLIDLKDEKKAEVQPEKSVPIDSIEIDFETLLRLCLELQKNFFNAFSEDIVEKIKELLSCDGKCRLELDLKGYSKKVIISSFSKFYERQLQKAKLQPQKKPADALEINHYENRSFGNTINIKVGESGHSTPVQVCPKKNTLSDQFVKQEGKYAKEGGKLPSIQQVVFYHTKGADELEKRLAKCISSDGFLDFEKFKPGQHFTKKLTTYVNYLFRFEYLLLVEVYRRMNLSLDDTENAKELPFGVIVALSLKCLADGHLKWKDILDPKSEYSAFAHSAVMAKNYSKTKQNFRNIFGKVRSCYNLKTTESLLKFLDETMIEIYDPKPTEGQIKELESSKENVGDLKKKQDQEEKDAKEAAEKKVLDDLKKKQDQEEKDAKEAGEKKVLGDGLAIKQKDGEKKVETPVDNLPGPHPRLDSANPADIPTSVGDQMPVTTSFGRLIDAVLVSGEYRAVHYGPRGGKYYYTDGNETKKQYLRGNQIYKICVNTKHC